MTQAPGYVLRLPDEAFDVACFERLVADGGSRLGARRRRPRRRRSCGRRSPCGVATPTPSSRTRTGPVPRPSAWRSCAWSPRSGSIEAELACGRAAEMIPEIESLAREHPLREAFRAQLMIALYRAGRQADALRVFRDYRHAARRGARASSRRRRWPRSSSGCSTTTRRWCSPSPPGSRCAGIASVSGSAPAATAPCTPPACPASSATSRSGSSGRRSPTAPSSCGRSRPAPSGWRRCGTRRSCRSTTTGGSRGPPTS